jgi:hypothetical protein
VLKLKLTGSISFSGSPPPILLDLWDDLEVGAKDVWSSSMTKIVGAGASPPRRLAISLTIDFPS